MRAAAHGEQPVTPPETSDDEVSEPEVSEIEVSVPEESTPATSEPEANKSTPEHNPDPKPESTGVPGWVVAVVAVVCLAAGVGVSIVVGKKRS